MKKKQQKKRNKKYQPLKKYNAGGRVGYAKGDMVQSTTKMKENDRFSLDRLGDGNVNTASNQQGEPKDPPNGKATVVRNGFIFAWQWI